MTWRASSLATPARKVLPSGYCCRQRVTTITTPNDETTDTQPWKPNRATRPSAQPDAPPFWRSEEHTSELQSRENLVCRLLLEKKKYTSTQHSKSITNSGK